MGDVQFEAQLGLLGRLPVEIRVMIYEFYCSAYPTYTRLYGRRGLQPDFIQSLTPPLLRASEAILAEAYKAWAKNAFFTYPLQGSSHNALDDVLWAIDRDWPDLGYPELKLCVPPLVNYYLYIPQAIFSTRKINYTILCTDKFVRYAIIASIELARIFIIDGIMSSESLIRALWEIVGKHPQYEPDRKSTIHCWPLDVCMFTDITFDETTRMYTCELEGDELRISCSDKGDAWRMIYPFLT